MPVMEAMCVGVPVVATACGSMPELLDDGRGFLMKTQYSMIDPWGNSRRDFPDADDGARIIAEISNGVPMAPSKARLYIETRTLETPVLQLINAMEKLDEE